MQTHLNRLVKELRLIFRPTHGPPLAGGDSLNAGRAAGKWCKKAAASHPYTHCTLLGCAFLTCKWPPEGFTHCASNLDTGTRPRILFSSTHLCIFVTWVSTVNFSGRYHLANVSYSVVRLRKKKQQQYACLIVSFVLKTMC